MTTISEVKEFHKRVCMSQGLSEEEFLADCKQLDLSVDGVQETKHGKRKFVFVTVRFGGRAVYILKVLNPLLKVTPAKASPDTLIGFAAFRK